MENYLSDGSFELDILDYLDSYYDNGLLLKDFIQYLHQKYGEEEFSRIIAKNIPNTIFIHLGSFFVFLSSFILKLLTIFLIYIFISSSIRKYLLTIII